MRHILMVDDDPLMREGTVRILSLEGYDITEAGTVEEAVTALEKGGIDLLISDGSIPPHGAGAWRLCAEKAQEGGVPFIVHSGSMTDDPEDPMARAVRSLGGVPLPKPAMRIDMERVVKEALGSM